MGKLDRKAESGIMLILLSMSTIQLACNVHQVSASATIYIKPDGSIDPSTAPIQRDGDIYTFTANIYDSIVVQKDNTVIDGAGYTLQGTEGGNGIDLTRRSNVTIKNSRIMSFDVGIWLSESSRNNIFGNNLTENGHGIEISAPPESLSSLNNNIFENNIKANRVGIWLFTSSNTSIYRNILVNNDLGGICVYGSQRSYSNYNSIYENSIVGSNNAVRFYINCSYNRVFHNNFYSSGGFDEGTLNLWDNDYPSGGNYWSYYTGVDANVDGIGDTPYPILVQSQDRYPLMSPWPPWGDWKHYHNYTEIVNTLIHLERLYPNIVDVFSIGKSWQNRDIYCIRLTNETNTHPKPKVLFVGYHHAREPISAELPLYFIVDAVTKFGTNATITHMLNYSEIYVVVALNVDASDVVKQNEWQRKNVHPFDEDEDGLLDEDPPDDQDGDGYIEDLWQWDGFRWIFLGWEGIDNDGDGFYNEDWVGGVDLNRNYGYQWNATCDSGSPYPPDEDYRGPAPFSEPETQVIRDLALSHNFKYAVSFHSGSDVILYPWGYTRTPTPDDQKFREIAGNMSVLIGSPYEQSSRMYTTSGVWDDWMYGNRSTLALTCEIYTNSSAWQYEPGPYPDSWWERGVFQFFNPAPDDIVQVVQKWLPVFTYIANRSIAEAYDIATTNVTPLKTVVGQGFSMHVNVTVTNQGDFTETFRVTVYANTTALPSQIVTLSSGESATITFTWNTLGFVKGNYNITAYATPIPGETDRADNTSVDDTVTVTIVGDVDGDRDVDASDLSDLNEAYGSDPPRTNWNPNCDINNDSKVDALDLFNMGKNYGKTNP